MRQQEHSSQGRLRAAAKTLFAERGYDATAISDITRAAKTSHSQFLKYYSGKEELRREILEEQWSELTRSVILAMSSVPSATDKLRLALNMLISFLESDAEFRSILLLEQTAFRHQRAPAATPQFREFVLILDEILKEMATDGELQAKVNVQSLRSALIGAVEGMMRDQLLATATFPAAYSIADVRSMLSALIDSVTDFQRPSTEQSSIAFQASKPSAEDDWIRYYLKLADKAMVSTDVS